MRAALSPNDVPDTQPATELLRGELVQKLSPGFVHAQVQGALSAFIYAYIRERGVGRFGTELDVNLSVGTDSAERFVPDIAYLDETSPIQTSKGGAMLSPITVAFEIASPDDRWRSRVAYKIERYLAAGVLAVVAIDPIHRSVHVHASDRTTHCSGADTCTIDAMPGFSFSLADLFAVLDSR